MIGANGVHEVQLARFRSETQQRLAVFVSLLQKWNPVINLVARSSLGAVWTRHIADSLQLLALRRPDTRTWADLGSGAGFPGMVIAIGLAELAPNVQMTLVESDHRKAEFMRVVSRETGVQTTVVTDRIETLPPLNVDILSARALAPLTQLCAFAHRHLGPDGRAIFLKGAQADAEIAAARRRWQFQLDRHTSQTDPDASILELSEVHHG